MPFSPNSKFISNIYCHGEAVTYGVTIYGVAKLITVILVIICIVINIYFLILYYDSAFFPTIIAYKLSACSCISRCLSSDACVSEVIAVQGRGRRDDVSSDEARRKLTCDTTRCMSLVSNMADWTRRLDSLSDNRISLFGVLHLAAVCRHRTCRRGRRPTRRPSRRPSSSCRSTSPRW